MDRKIDIGELTTMKVCKQCGAEYDDDSFFCGKCGTALLPAENNVSEDTQETGTKTGSVDKNNYESYASQFDAVDEQKPEVSVQSTENTAALHTDYQDNTAMQQSTYQNNNYPQQNTYQNNMYPQQNAYKNNMYPQQNAYQNNMYQQPYYQPNPGTITNQAQQAPFDPNIHNLFIHFYSIRNDIRMSVAISNVCNYVVLANGQQLSFALRNGVYVVYFIIGRKSYKRTIMVSSQSMPINIYASWSGRAQINIS